MAEQGAVTVLHYLPHLSTINARRKAMFPFPV